MKRTVNTMIISWWASCKKIHTTESFFIYVTDVIYKEIRWKTIILHWLSSSEHDHDLKLILNFLDSKNTELILEKMILYET